MPQADEDEARRIDAERGEAVGVEFAALAHCLLLADPDDRHPGRRAGEGEQRGEAVRRGLVAGGGGVEFMHRAAGKPAAELRIHIAAIDRDEARGGRPRNLARRLDRRNALPQCGKGRRLQTHPRHTSFVLINVHDLFYNDSG